MLLPGVIKISSVYQWEKKKSGKASHKLGGNIYKTHITYKGLVSRKYKICMNQPKKSLK